MMPLQCIGVFIVLVITIASMAFPKDTIQAPCDYDGGSKPALAWLSPRPSISNTTFEKRAHPSFVTGFLPDHCNELKRAKEAFPLMLRLVQFSLNYLADPTKTESFNRYFQPSHRRTVFNVFRKYFTTKQPAPEGDPSSPKFSNVAIAYGKQPCSEEGDCEENDSNTWLAHFYNTVPGASNFAARALVLCPAAFTETPNELPQPGDKSRCSTLKDFATYDMDCLSATLLHEFLHYRFLINHATASDIVDWGVDPPYSETKLLPQTAYGPYRSFYLNQKSTISTTPQRDPRLNADNYVWLALEIYWSALCDKDFVDPLRGQNT